ncbi:MAG: hypothetical protein BV458_03415 [Thermoplasmata archaeon M9B2D]|nr:MAG: hypothetical protein BV458_03415 [Thermoplasmata archaeon M9B2D]
MFGTIKSNAVSVKDETVVSYIEKSYLGEAKIISCSYLEAKTGAKGLDIQFETPNNERFTMSSYFVSKSGEPIDFQLSRIIKIMTMAGKQLENLKWTKGKNRFNKDGMICEELVGVSMTLYAQHKWEVYNNKARVKHDILDVFYTDSKLTIAEHNAGETHPERYLSRKSHCITRNDTETKPMVGQDAPKKNFTVQNDTEEAF